MGDLTDHFSRKEFTCKCGCGLNRIDRALVDRLESARRLYGKPMVVTSGTRCETHNNTFTTAVLDSSHLYGKAADLWCPDSRTRYELLMALFTVGFQRIGQGRNYVHVDIDYTKDQDVCWLY